MADLPQRAVAIQIVPDRWKDVVANRATNVGSNTNRNGGQGGTVRRPTRGIVLKQDTYATLQVITGKNEPITLLDGGSAKKNDKNEFLTKDGNPNRRATDVYSNFLIQQVTEERAEKQQILETFGEPYIFLFGQRARMLNVQGVLLNTFDFNWESEWWENYEQYLRGTRCVETDSRVFLTFDDTMVGGYILACTSSKTASERNHVPLAFQMFITSSVDIGNRIGNPNAKPPWATEEIDLNSAAAMAPFRPTLLNGTTTLSNTDVGLIDSLLQTETYSKVKGFFNDAKKMANTMAAGFNSLVSQFDIDAVRVPIGYAGVTVFDETKVKFSMVGTKIKYSTFDANWDEYVGMAGRQAQYGSAVTTDGVLKMDTLFNDTSDAQQRTLVEKAKLDWHAAGYILPEESLGPLSTWVAGKGVGLLMSNTIKSPTPISTKISNTISSLPLTTPSVISAAKGTRFGGVIGIDGY